MGYLLVVIFFLALFLTLPLKAAVVFCGALLLSTLVVQATTGTVARVKVTLTESFKAIVLSTFFAMVAAFTTVSFLRGAPRDLINDTSGLLLMVLQYTAYVLGFRMALGLIWPHAALVALLSTLITSVSIWFISSMATG